MDLTPAAIFSFFTRSDSVETIARMVEQRRGTDRPYTQNCINLLSDYLRGNEDMVQGIRKQVTAQWASGSIRRSSPPRPRVISTCGTCVGRK